MTAKNKKGLFGPRDVADQANNLVVKALKPVSLGGEIPEVRLRRLRAYSQAALAPMLTHVEEDILRPEELVIVLATAALYVQLKYVLKTDKMPQGRAVTDIYESKLPIDTDEIDAEPASPRKPGRKKSV